MPAGLPITSTEVGVRFTVQLFGFPVGHHGATRLGPHLSTLSTASYAAVTLHAARAKYLVAALRYAQGPTRGAHMLETAPSMALSTEEYKRILDQFQRPLFRFVRSLVGNGEEVNDIV
jgi:hypothetical protein